MGCAWQGWRTSSCWVESVRSWASADTDSRANRPRVIQEEVFIHVYGGVREGCGMCGAEWLVCVVGLGRLGCLSKPEPRIGSFKKGDENDKLRQWPRGRVEPQLFSSARYPAQIPSPLGCGLDRTEGATHPSGVVGGADQPMDFVVKAGRATHHLLSVQ